MLLEILELKESPQFDTKLWLRHSSPTLPLFHFAEQSTKIQQ